MSDLAEVEPSALSVWLRTGRWPRPDAEAPRFNFNPNHDPADGRFTFGGGGGASGSWTDPAPQSDRKPVSKPPLRIIVPTVAASTRSAAHGAVKPELHHIVVNGYDYGIDDQGWTRIVSGTLTLNPDQGRSRGAQAGAGGADRLPSDDGGHYIARRFDGPTAAFNYFAQDLNVNRSRYRVLEDQWATAKRSGKEVVVKIIPTFGGKSQRPSALSIKFSISGNKESVIISNSP